MRWLKRFKRVRRHTDRVSEMAAEMEETKTIKDQK